MIKNKLTLEELSCIVRPFLRLEPADVILRALETTLRITVKSRSDILCQKQLLVTFKGYRLDIRDLQVFEGRGLSLLMQFKAPTKWWRGLFHYQNAEVVSDLKRICQSEVDGLKFARYETTVAGDVDDGPLARADVVLFHDSRALNRKWKYGYEVSPLTISPDAHHGNCFVEFLFNPLAYQRASDKTVLREDWIDSASAISDGLEAAVKRLLGA